MCVNKIRNFVIAPGNIIPYKRENGRVVLEFLLYLCLNFSPTALLHMTGGLKIIHIRVF